MDDKLQNKYETMLNEFKMVLAYGLDNAYSTAKNEIDNKFRLSFFDEIYCSRPYSEDKIIDWIKSQIGDFGIIVGVQGCGKSTIVKLLERELDINEYPILSIDFRIFYPKRLEPINRKCWKLEIENCLKEILTNRYFPDLRIDGYFSTYLYVDSDTKETFLDEKNQLHRLYELFRRENPESKINEMDWFKSNQYSKSLRTIISGIDKKMTLEHYLKASRKESNNNIVQFIIIFDNVDRIPKYYQSDLYQIAEDIRSHHHTSVNTLITTRKETCHPPAQICNINPASIMEFGIFGSRESEKNKLTQDDFNKLLLRRIVYYDKHFNKDKEVEKNNIIKLSKLLRKEYVDLYLINLANQSIREALLYHYQFIKYLFEQYPDDKLFSNINRPSGGSFLMSCFYGWISTYSMVLKKQCVNVVELVKHCWKEKQYKGITGCDLSYLILVCLHNFNRRYGRNPTFSELKNKFQVLKYSENRIREELFKLWELYKEDFGYIINIYQLKMPEGPTDIKENSEIEINFRGESLIKHISVSFTFINRILFDTRDQDFYDLEKRRAINEKSNYYDIYNVVAHSKYTVVFLYRLALLHSLELHKIRSRYNVFNWYDEYASDFCIDKKLQLKRIIRSNTVFINKIIDTKEIDTYGRNILKLRLKQLDILDRIYDRQVESFTLENLTDTKIINYVKFINENIENSDISNDYNTINKIFSEYKMDIFQYLR